MSEEGQALESKTGPAESPVTEESIQEVVEGLEEKKGNRQRLFLALGVGLVLIGLAWANVIRKPEEAEFGRSRTPRSTSAEEMAGKVTKRRGVVDAEEKVPEEEVIPSGTSRFLPERHNTLRLPPDGLVPDGVDGRQDAREQEQRRDRRPRRQRQRSVETRVERRAVESEPDPARSLLVRGGTQIHATVMHPVTSDGGKNPGLLARVTQPIYDSRYPAVVVVPSQTVLLGVFPKSPSLGERSVGVVWVEAQAPGTGKERRLKLVEMRGGDPDGTLGVSGKINFRWGSVYGHALLLSSVGALSQIAQEAPSNGGVRFGQIAAEEFGRRSNTATEQIVEKLLERPARFQLERGAPITVQVSQDWWIDDRTWLAGLVGDKHRTLQR